MRVLEGEGACHFHGYGPRQLCDPLLVLSLCRNGIMSDVGHEMLPTPLQRYT